VVLYKYSITFHLGLTAEVKDRRWEDHHYGVSFSLFCAAQLFPFIVVLFRRL